MESQEVVTPLVREDFSDGDRVYSYSNNLLSKGTIIYDPEEYQDHVTVWMDDGYQLPLHISCFVKDSGTYYWGKIPALGSFRPDMVISHLGSDGIRQYAEIRHVIPGDRIRMKRITGYGEYFDHTATYGTELEDLFLDWEIEE